MTRNQLWASLFGWGLGLALLSAPVAFSATPLLIGESIGEVTDRPLAPRPGSFQVGFNMASTLPISRPFKTTGGDDFQFQVSRSTGLEIEMGWTKRISFAVSGAWEAFETRLDTSTNSSGVTNVEFQKASVSLVPIMLAAKYRFRDSGWTPEVEVGAGMGLYRFTLSSTNQSAVTDRNSTASFLADALVGARFFWNDAWSLAFHVGYRYTAVGKQSLSNGVSQVEASNFTGLLSRGGISYRF